MTSLGLLVSELQSLASETRRKHPEVREAADKALTALRAASSAEQLSPDAELLLRPILLGLATKNAKVISLSLGSLQRLISLQLVPSVSLPPLLQSMAECVRSQGVDIQLRILQTLVGLITGLKHAVGGELLGDALLLCFKLHESKITVVSSTAAATLRQLVMFVSDKVVEEDRRAESAIGRAWETEEVVLPDENRKTVGPSAKDVYSIFEDLCLLCNSEKPKFLKLEFLSKTFGLELIESVLTNYSELFRVHTELILLLQHHLCPLLLKALSDRPVFPLTLRCTRVVFLLLKKFNSELETEVEVFLMLLIRLANEEADADHRRPHWLRVLAMEVIRGLSSDAELMRNVWARYDARQPDAANVLTSLITLLNQLLMEKPALLGSSPSLGLGDTNHSPSGMVGMMAGIMGGSNSGGGLSLTGSTMKVQCIDQLDKADSPSIPETYIYLLGLQCLISLCDGFASYVLPYHQRSTRSDTVEPSETEAQIIEHLRAMTEANWSTILSSLSSILTTNLSDDLFVDVLKAYESMTNVSGLLGVVEARDSFLMALSRLAVPINVLSSFDSAALSTFPSSPSNETPRTANTLSESLGFGSSGQGNLPQPLSEKNLTCLKVFIGCAMTLAGLLSESCWFTVMDVLQNAESLLVLSTPATGTLSQTPTSSPMKRVSRSISSSSMAAHANMPSGPQVDALVAMIQRLFDTSKTLDDGGPFEGFIAALCRTSRDTIASDVDPSSSVNASSDQLDVDIPSIAVESAAPGISVKKKASRASGDFGISKLGGVAMLNLHRLMYRPPIVAWTAITSHLVSVIRNHHARSAVRTQAATIFDKILVGIMKNKDVSPDVQIRVLAVLKEQVLVSDGAEHGTNTELKKMGLETLHEIVQGSSHALVDGISAWESIFEMLGSVCPAPALQSSEVAPSSSKVNHGLVKIAFQSLTFICDSSVPILDPAHLRFCIKTIGLFGKQTVDRNIALTAAASLLWSVSDGIQAKRKGEDEAQAGVYSGLWMLLLLELLGLCSDARPEVRDGAIQTLFRSTKLYGQTLSLEMWDECLWNVVFPLLDVLGSQHDLQDEWAESRVLAFQSIGGILAEYLPEKIMKLEKFAEVWDTLLNHISQAALNGRSGHVCSATLRCMEKALLKLEGADHLERAWRCIDEVGEAVVSRSTEFTQENIVALVDAIRALRTVNKSGEWDLERLRRLMAILKGCMTYPNSPDYRPDIDALPPVQAIVFDTVQSVNMDATGVPSLVMRDLAEFVTLPFLGAFDVPPPPPAPNAPSTSQAAPVRSTSQKVTYIALGKKAMPYLVALFLKFKDRNEIYIDGTLEQIVAGYSIPIKLKYECPPSSKFEKDVPPLWKTATTNFLRIVKEIALLASDIPVETVEGIWRQVLDVFRGGILADCSSTLNMSLSTQEEEEQFDQALIVSLEKDVVPYLGDPRLSDSVIKTLGILLAKGSAIVSPESLIPTPPLSPIRSREHLFDAELHGTTVDGSVLPRERFSYWCFDLLFTITRRRDATGDEEKAYRRLAALSLPALLQRCKTSLLSYVKDEGLRGGLPFPRARDDELLYTLRQLRDLELWSGSLWAAISEEPSRFSAPDGQPDLDVSNMADGSKRSSKAHLFWFYDILAELASIPRRSPVGYTYESDPLDARVLARETLRIIGKEMRTPVWIQ